MLLFNFGADSGSFFLNVIADNKITSFSFRWRLKNLITMLS